MTLGTALNDYLDENSLTGKEFALQVGISETSVSKCRNGGNCNQIIKDKIANAIGYVEKPEIVYESEIEYVERDEAAQRMGMTKGMLEAALRANAFPFGVAFKNKGEHYNYFIFRTDFEKYIEEHKTPQK